jgi:hypothetical protein
VYDDPSVDPSLRTRFRRSSMTTSAESSAADCWAAAAAVALLLCAVGSLPFAMGVADRTGTVAEGAVDRELERGY